MLPKCYYCGYYHEGHTAHYTGTKDIPSQTEGATNMSISQYGIEVCFCCNTRQECFSNDGGSTWYCMNDTACRNRVKPLSMHVCAACNTEQECVTFDGANWTCANGDACFERQRLNDLLSTNMPYAIETHYQWLVKMGYTKTTPLESLALICSEIGEAVNECRHGQPTDKFGKELADIVLRVFGLARRYNIDIAQEMRDKIVKNYASGDNRGRTICD